MGRIVRPADFQRVLGTPPWARSVHFALHHLARMPSRPRWNAGKRPELSTNGEHACQQSVDDSKPSASGVPAEPAPQGWWLGMVVPKRHAKRSVTRSLLKRQIRAAVGRSTETSPALNPGLWVVRLRTPIDRKRYPSAASDALRNAMHDELQQMMDQALKRCHG